ncbi:hypothetical protein ACMZ62_07085 [Streptococcus pluranimalium]
MTSLEEIEEKVNKLKESFDVFSAYDKRIADIDNEIEVLSQKETLVNQTRIGQLTEERKDLVVKGNKNTVDNYDGLYAEAYLIDIHGYFNDELTNDKELNESRKQYEKLKNEMLDALISYNKLVDTKKLALVKQVRSTGYSDIIRKIADNDTAKILGMRRPGDQTKNYFNQSRYIEVPYGLNDDYKQRLKKYRPNKPNTKKKKLFSFR